MGDERTTTFTIKGANPSTANAIQYVSYTTAGQHDVFSYYPAILMHESAMGPFNLPNANCYSGDYCQGMPNWGFPDGWGMAQIDLSGSGGYLPPAQLWNWTANVFMGLSVLQDKIEAHDRYMDALRECCGTDFVDTDVYSVTKTWTATNGVSIAYTLENSDIIKRYNGASGSILAGGPALLICDKPYPYSWHYSHASDGCGAASEGEPVEGEEEPCPCNAETLCGRWTFYGIDTYPSGHVTNYVQGVTEKYVRLN